MKPHRRKPTPPRRDDGGGAPEVPAEQDLPAEEVYYEESAAEPQAEVAYEPVEQEQAEVYYEEQTAEVQNPETYPEQEQAYYDPNAVAGGHVEGAPPAEGEVYYEEAAAEPAAEGEVYYEQPVAEEPVYEEPAIAPPPSISPSAGVYDAAPAEPAPVEAAPPVRKPKTGRRTANAGRLKTGTAARRSSSYQRPKPSYGGGISVMDVFTGLVTLGMVALIVMVLLPKDLSFVSGYPHSPSSAGSPRNLLDEAQKVMTGNSPEVTFTEEEVNAYLNTRLQGDQTGLVASIVKFNGVYTDFTPEHVEIIVEREILGLPITLSSKVRNEDFRGQVVYRSAGWSLGSLDIGSRNIKPVIQMFLRLRNTTQEEFRVLQSMRQVIFGENQITLVSAIGGA